MASQQANYDMSTGIAVASSLSRHLVANVSAGAIRAAADMGIADIIHDLGHPATVQEIAAALPATVDGDTSRLQRFLRFLVADGFLHRDPNDGQYALNPLSLLFTGAVRRKEMRSHAESHFLPACIEAWECLPTCIQQGGTAFAHRHHGQSLFQYFHDKPHYNSIFCDSMATMTRVNMPLILKGPCRSAFQGLGSLVDVGGGTGAAAKAISDEFGSEIHCIVLDLPHVVANAPPHSNIEYVGGDMLEYIPPADAAFIMNVLHNWNDEDCIKILSRCKEAVVKKEGSSAMGKVIAVERVILEETAAGGATTQDMNMNWLSLAMDMVMMALPGGKERTKEEWIKIFDAAKFSELKFTNLYGGLSIR